jgi:hypothetical protein
MKKIIVSALVAVTAVATLSACKVEDGSTDSGKNQQNAAGGKDAPSYTVAQENAIESAHSYLDLSGFSRAGLIQQLTSKAGEGFKMTDAMFAVNHIKVDYNKEAVESGKAYLDISSFSRASLIQQLSSTAGDQFTPAQATYAANHVGL